VHQLSAVAFHGGSSWLTAVRQISDCHLWGVSLIIAQCWHPCRNLHRHNEVSQCLQQNCSSLQGIQTQLADKTVHYLQSYCYSGLWISIGVHVMDLYFRFVENIRVCSYWPYNP
jgi:hypothetical protein